MCYFFNSFDTFAEFVKIKIGIPLHRSVAAAVLAVEYIALLIVSECNLIFVHF